MNTCCKKETPDVSEPEICTFSLEGLKSNKEHDESYCMMSLIESLNCETIDSLKKRLAGLAFTGSTALKKAELINLLEQQLQTNQLKLYWGSQLTTIEKKVVAEVVYGSPDLVFDPEQFYAKYKERPKFFRSSKSTSYSYYNQEITCLGAFFFNQRMPYELASRFKSFIEKPDGFELTSENTLPNMPSLSVTNRETAALFELKVILKLVSENKIKVSDKTSYPSAASINIIENCLHGGDFYSEFDTNKLNDSKLVGSIRSFAWVMLIQAAKLAKRSGNTLELTAAGKTALKTPPENTLKKLWQSWLTTKLFDEFKRIDAIKGQTGKGKRELTDPISRRAVIKQVLCTIPLNRWIHFDEFSRYMLSNRLTFELVKCAPWGLYICSPDYGSLGHAGYHSWPILQERYLLCFLFEYAATLGLIDIAYIPPHNARENFRDIWGTDDLRFLSRYDGLRYFKINNLGLFILELNAAYVPNHSILPEKIDLHIAPDGVITVESSSLSENVRLMLDQFCQRDTKNTWILNEESLITAAETRHNIASLMAFFLENDINIPNNIKTLIGEISSKVNQIKIKGRVVLFECVEADFARHFSSISSINRYCTLVAEKTLVVPEDKFHKFKSAIKKFGYVIHE